VLLNTTLSGNYSVGPGQVVIVGEGAVLNVSGCANFSGATVQIELSNNNIALGSHEIVLVNAACIVSAFSNVQVSAPACQSVSVQQQQQNDGHTLVAFLQVHDSCGAGSKLSSAALAGIVTGVIVVAVLVGVVIGVWLWYARKKELERVRNQADPLGLIVLNESGLDRSTTAGKGISGSNSAAASRRSRAE